MSNLYVKVNDQLEQLDVYCKKMSKKNNALLYKLENYLGKKLMTDDELVEIRDVILTVSADISRISDLIVVDGEDNEKL
ncbi:hypothetical protein D3C84_484970 [compost metagenome]